MHLVLLQLAEEWDNLHNRYAECSSHHQSDTPVAQSSPTPPAGRATSASHPQLHTLHPPPPPPPPSSLSRRSPSDTLPSSDVANSSFAPPANFSHSQSHPNIHTLMHAAPSKPDSGSNLVETDSGQALTSSSDSHTTSVTPPAHETLASPRNYVNFDIDELRNGPDHDRKLRSLSPLELSIERELERNGQRLNKGSSEDDGQEAADSEPTGNTGEAGPVDVQQLHPYANWQFEKMNEKSQNTTPKANAKLLNGGPVRTPRPEPTSRSKPAPIPISVPRKPLKPPSPFKLPNLSDLTALDKPSPSPRDRERLPTRNVGEGGGGGGGADGAPGADESTRPLGKALSTSRLHDISPTTERRNKGLADTASHSTRHVDQLLPSQLNLGSKPRSYTTSHFLPKKKPILPPVGTKHKSHAKMPAVNEIAGTIPEQRETLENSGELERSFKRGSSKTAPSSSSAQLGYSKSMHSSLGRDAIAPAAAKHTRLSSPSNELMRKLSLRRQKLEQQIVTPSKHTSGSTTASSATGGDSSSRCTSTSSTQSELVCSYNTKRSQEDSSLDESSLVEVRTGDEANLAKYGIMEDVEGGSFVI